MSQLYGSQGSSIGENAFIWASAVCLTMMGPTANMSGQIFHGTLPMSALLDSTGVSKYVTINDLINNATQIQ